MNRLVRFAHPAIWQENTGIWNLFYIKLEFLNTEIFYFVLKNLVLPRAAGFSMGLACPALRESEFFGSA